jgi:hypothetical protein
MWTIGPTVSTGANEPTAMQHRVTVNPSQVQPQPATTLSSIFNIQTYPFSIIIAAIFGITPGLLVDQLKQQTEQYKRDLRSTRSAERDTKRVE